MRVVIEIEDDQPFQAPSSAPSTEGPAENAGAAPAAAAGSTAAEQAVDPAAGDLTIRAISAGPAPAAHAILEPQFSNALQGSSAPDPSEASADVSAGPAPSGA